MCKHPPNKLYAWVARDDTVKDGKVLVVACKQCHKVIKN